MVTRILSELEENNIVRELCENMRVSPSDMDDFVQEIYVILLEYNPDRIIEMYKKKQLKFFLVGVIQRQYHSNTSPFFKKYKKYYQMIDGNYVNKEELNDDIDDFE